MSATWTPAHGVSHIPLWKVWNDESLIFIRGQERDLVLRTFIFGMGWKGESLAIDLWALLFWNSFLWDVFLMRGWRCGVWLEVGPCSAKGFHLSDGSASSYVSWGRIFCDCLWSQIALLQLASFVILRVKSFCSTTWLTWNRYSLACFWSLFSFCFSCYTKMFCFAVSRRCACSLRI